MPLADVKAQVLAEIQGIAGIGNVYDYQPRVVEESEFQSKMITAGKVNAVTITRASAPTRWRTIKSRSDRHQLVIRYFYGLNDTGDPATTSETIFEALVEAVRNTLDANRQLRDANGAAHCFESGPVQVKAQTWAMVVGVLCHYAEMLFEVEEYPVTL